MLQIYTPSMRADDQCDRAQDCVAQVMGLESDFRDLIEQITRGMDAAVQRRDMAAVRNLHGTALLAQSLLSDAKAELGIVLS